MNLPAPSAVTAQEAEIIRTLKPARVTTIAAVLEQCSHIWPRSGIAVDDEQVLRTWAMALRDIPEDILIEGGAHYRKTGKRFPSPADLHEVCAAAVQQRRGVLREMRAKRAPRIVVDGPVEAWGAEVLKSLGLPAPNSFELHLIGRVINQVGAGRWFQAARMAAEQGPSAVSLLHRESGITLIEGR